VGPALRSRFDPAARPGGGGRGPFGGGGGGGDGLHHDGAGFGIQPSVDVDHPTPTAGEVEKGPIALVHEVAVGEFLVGEMAPVGHRPPEIGH
jgi:hypothetical protein